MVRTPVFLLVLGWTAVAQTPLTLPQIMARVGKEADAFQKIAPTTLSEETLEQRSLILTQAPEAAALKGPSGSNFETHEIISEYGYASPPGAPNALHEIRKIISVDGRQVTTVEKARHAMTLGLNSSEVKLKKRLLEEFERHGLHGAATDFGQLILLFTPVHLGDYKFQMREERQIGADRLVVIGYEQVSGAGGFTVFRGNTVRRQPISGELMVRKRDGVPMRVTMTALSAGKDLTVKDESTVDYADSQLGVVMPASVVHREYLKDTLVSENTFFYAAFRKMGQRAAELP
jgi:hypothetical protein